MTTHSLARCVAALRRGESLSTEAGGPEAKGDALLASHAFEDAVACYAACSTRTPGLDAKQGWCLVMLDRFAEAGAFLNGENASESSTALAALALIAAGGWTKRHMWVGFGEEEGAVERRATVDDLVGRALAFEEPDSLAFLVYRTLVARHGEPQDALAVAERGLALYISADLDVWRSQLLRTLGRIEPSALDILMAHMETGVNGAVASEAFHSAMLLSRFDVALRVIDQVAAAPWWPDAAPALTVLRAHVETQMADAKEATAVARRILVTLDHVRSVNGDSENPPGVHELLAVEKLAMAMAVQVGDREGVRKAAMAMADLWDEHEFEFQETPGTGMISAGCLMHEADFGDAYRADLVRESLQSGERERWAFYQALHAQLYDDDPGVKAMNDLYLYGPAFTPGWAFCTVAAVLMEGPDTDLRNAGRLLALDALRHESPGDEGDYSDFVFKSLSPGELEELVDGMLEGFGKRAPSTHGAAAPLLDALDNVLFRAKAFEPLRRLADVAAAGQGDTHNGLFFAALARQELGEHTGARERYEQLLEENPGHRSAYWNLALIHADAGNPKALESLAKAVDAHAVPGDKAWKDAIAHVSACLKRATAKAQDQHRMVMRDRALASFPPLATEMPEVDSLSLPEAAMLLALLRAAELDHSRWLLGPYEKGEVPLEPTSLFRRILFSLANKGIIRISEISPPSAFGEQEGELTYVLGQLSWHICPVTLGLQRAIRDMARKDWPMAWDVHAESFARDVAVEECVRYMEHLATERDIDPPARDNARPVFRGLLEHASLGQCFYYIHTGAKSALEHKAKYSPRRAAVTTVMLKRMTERGEKAIEQGWNTAYDRIKAMPRSHLEAVLHDVLTGWGEQAFTNPVRMLASAPRSDSAEDSWDA